jgi:ribosomal protein S17
MDSKHKHIVRKVEKYVKHNDINKFKSYIKRHHVTIKDLRLKRGNTLLHIACKYGSDVIIR